MVTGPTDSIAVPVNITAAGASNSGRGGDSQLDIIWWDGPFRPGVLHLGVVDTMDFWTYNQTIMLATNSLYKVDMHLSGNSCTGYAGCIGDGFNAFVDPTFTIGSGYGDYSLIFSEGVGNSPVAVPGPVVGAGIPGLIALFSTGWFYWRRRFRLWFQGEDQ
jgi:hypothetical protein